MNQLMLEVKDHHVANETVKFVKKYSIDFEKVMKKLQLTIFKCKKKVNRNIRATVVYILNDFKRAHSKTYSDLFALIQKNLCAADLMIKNIRLIKNFQTNVFFDNNFVKSFSVIVSRVDITEVNTSTFSTRAVVFKFSILKIVSATSRKASQVEKIDQLNKSNVFLSVINLVSS